ncbi:MAG: DUF3187 family protein [Candidatus Manganitrophus sp. SB1]|nr:DUF3187 family protein [Candidatus Manganitrophus morganii]
MRQGCGSRRGRFALGCILSLLLFSHKLVQAESAHPCSENVGFGPLGIRGQSYFQMLHLTPTPSAPSTLRKGEWEGQALLTWVNGWAVSKGHYMIDTETLQWTGKLSYALNDRIQFGLELPVLWRGGGYLDRSIEGFHHAFNLGNGRRDRFPRNRTRFEFHRKDGSTFVLEDSGIGLQDAVFSSQVSLTCGGAKVPAAGVSLSVSLPTDREEKLYGTDGIDVSGTLLFAKRISRVYLYLNFSYVRLGSGDFVGIPLHRDKWVGFAAVEYRLKEGTSLILQNTLSSGVAEDFFEFSDYTDEMAFGFKTAFSNRLVWEAGVIENLFNIRNGPDFGIHTGLSYRF